MDDDYRVNEKGSLVKKKQVTRKKIIVMEIDGKIYKTCTRCDQSKTLNNFRFLKTGKLCKDSFCIPCRKYAIDDWYYRNEEKYKKQACEYASKYSKRPEVIERNHTDEYRRRSRESMKKRYKINKEKRMLDPELDKEIKLKNRDIFLKYSYGMSSEQYNEMLKKQNESCKTCKIHFTQTKKQVLSVDHCHKTNKVRALLCEKCNTALGLVGDNRQVLLNLFNLLVETETGS